MHHPPENFKEKEYIQRIRKVLADIHENLSDELSLERLAQIAFFSPFHFQKIFSLYVGESPKQYIMRLRLERIAHYLKLYPELSIGDASFQCGFSSPATFIRAFKKYYGTTPDAFRRLSWDDISKIGILKTKTGKHAAVFPFEFRSMNMTMEEAEGFPSAMDIEVKTVRSLNVAFLESHLGDDDAIPAAFRALTRWAEPRDLISKETRYIGVMLDMPFFTEYEKCRFRACITVPDETPAAKETGLMRIPDGKYATYFFQGTNHDLFRSLINFKHYWLDQSGYQIAEITGFELYEENPAITAYESIHRQVFIPVKPA
ncbi:MAG: AraC family transcriptional regulator [Bacteroidetes bacterium]|nr:AraC family transcriptional regulator [Bacteroidota bacterium]